MKLGLIARADNRGLGIQTWEFARHMNPAKVLVVDCPSKAPLPLHLERFPGAKVIHRFPTDADVQEFLEGLDVVFSAETFYNDNFVRIARERGVKTVLQLNWEFLDWADPARAHLPKPDLFASPSPWHYDEIPEPKVMLPVPIAADRFTPRKVSYRPARNFLHIVGRPAIHDRNGTGDLLADLRYVTSDIHLTIRCQDHEWLGRMMEDAVIPSNVDLTLDVGDTENYWDAYADQDVLVMPRRFGGLCLPVNEALGAGMPVIMPNISPNGWLPVNWLAPARRRGYFKARTNIAFYETLPGALAEMIDRLATEPLVFERWSTWALLVAQSLTWKQWTSEYEKIFEELTGS